MITSRAMFARHLADASGIWRLARLGAVAFGAALLAACASAPRAPEPIPGNVLSGRLSVRVEAIDDAPARAVSAAFELRGGPRVGSIDLATPLGSVLARARWDESAVTLATPQGARQFADLDAFTREVLGESVPIAALFDWLGGVPWAGAPSTPSAVGPTGAVTGFEQLGWAVDVSQIERAAVSARRAAPPAVTVRVQLDRS